jgi:hypothetical protein
VSSVNTSKQAIRDAINICVSALEVLRSTNTGLRGKYVAAGKCWSDSKYQQLGDIVCECGSSLDKAIRDLDACLVPLSDIARFVQEYEEVNVLGGVSSLGGGFSGNTSNHTPVNKGTWSGERGNSLWQPNDEEAIRDLQTYGNGAKGIEYRNGYADFTPIQVFECRLNSRLYYRNNDYQFVDCTLELREYLRELRNGNLDSRLMSHLSDEQLLAIERGEERIPGYTWHHDVQAGRMQLVATSIHVACPHEGGQSIWGGSATNR